MVGSMPGVSPGEYLTVRGQWVRHATYGPQFPGRRGGAPPAPGAEGDLPLTWPPGAIKGIGKATARQLIETFGEDALRVIEEEPEKLTTLKGISPKRARTISDAFRKQMGMRRLLEFLTEHRLPAELSGPLYRAYGDVALEVVRANPLCALLLGIWGGVLPGGRPGPLFGHRRGRPPAAGGRAAL